MKNIKLLNARGINCSLSNIFDDQTTKFLLAIEIVKNNQYLEQVARFVNLSKTHKNCEVIPSVVTSKLTAIALIDSEKNIEYIIIEEVD